jgi:hypothetical protein
VELPGVTLAPRTGRLVALLEKATWKEGTLNVTLLEPFQTLRHSNSVSTRKHKGNDGSTRNIEDWLPILDSNRDS